jgi:hypothetical protein
MRTGLCEHDKVVLGQIGLEAKRFARLPFELVAVHSALGHSFRDR